MEQSRVHKLYKDVTRARLLELELLALNEKERSLQEEVEELKQSIKPKKRLFGFGKKDQDDYEINQAKTRYDIAVQDLSYIQDSIRSKSYELANLQEAKQEFFRIYEKKLALAKLSGNHKEELQLLETAYLISLKRKESLPEVNKKVWRFQYEIQNVILILKQAAEAYTVSAGSNYSPYSKYERIDKAKEETEKLKKLLEELQTILSEMDLKFDMKFDTENFVSYAQEGNASYWTDSRFLSLQVGERVKEILKEFEEKEAEADCFRKELLEMEKNALKDLYEKQNQLEEYVMFLM